MTCGQDCCRIDGFRGGNGLNCFLIPFLLWRGVLGLLPEGSITPEEGERLVVINRDQQVVVFLEGQREANLALVSTGNPARFSTPAGDFSIRCKKWNPMSSTYMVRMPFWQGIEESGAIGMHQASPSVEYRLGEALSHGCIRLGHYTAEWAYYWLPVGARVIIR